MRAPLLAAALVFALCGASAETLSLHERVATLYDFAPHNLDDKQINAKSAELDAFWAEVKRSGPAGVDALRAELQRADAPSFFSFDGAQLLLSLSKDRADRQLALDAMARVDLRDVQWTAYFLDVHALSVEELDASEAAFKILEEPKFQAIIAAHALTLSQENCLSYLLLPTREAFYLDKTQRRLFEVKDVTAQKSLLTLLANTVTKSGDAAIARFAVDPAQPEESREYATMIIKATAQMESLPLFGLSLSSYASLKQTQRTLMARVSDEALGEWERLRIKIRHKGAQ